MNMGFVHSRETQAATSGALKRYTVSTDPVVRLICFPNAGAGASVYRRLARSLPNCIEVLSVQLPGREDRYREPRYQTMEIAATQLAREIARLDQLPVVLFGHSMGSILAFEVARELSLYGHPPKTLIVSGHGAPNARGPLNRCRHDVDDAMLIADLQRMGGTPLEILQDTQMMRTLLPIVRADYKILDSYTYRAGEQLNCPIITCAGDQDTEVYPESVRAWGTHTTTIFKEHWFPGGHFYLFSSSVPFNRHLQDWVLRTT